MTLSDLHFSQMGQMGVQRREGTVTQGKQQEASDVAVLGQ